MNIQIARLIRVLLLAGFAASVSAVRAEDPSEPPYARSVVEGPYLAAMASVMAPVGNQALGLGYGGAVALGYRQHFFSIEARGLYDRLPAKEGSDTNVFFKGGSLNALLFPFSKTYGTAGADSLGRRALGNSYVIIGGGARNIRGYPDNGQADAISTTMLSAGIGDLFQLHLGRYAFAIRGEVLYQYDHREKQLIPSGITSPPEDLDIPTNYRSVAFNLGIHLPLTFPHAADLPATPVHVVPVSGDSASPPAPTGACNAAASVGCAESASPPAAGDDGTGDAKQKPSSNLDDILGQSPPGK
jgi:hypothetical protein